jgi:hypothetical protein
MSWVRFEFLTRNAAAIGLAHAVFHRIQISNFKPVPNSQPCLNAHKYQPTLLTNRSGMHVWGSTLFNLTLSPHYVNLHICSHTWCQGAVLQTGRLFFIPSPFRGCGTTAGVFSRSSQFPTLQCHSGLCAECRGSCCHLGHSDSCCWTKWIAVIAVRGTDYERLFQSQFTQSPFL